MLGPKKCLPKWYHTPQGGSWQNNTGWALCSNDDVIMLMTSLLLLYPVKIVGGPRPTRPLPPWVQANISATRFTEWVIQACFFDFSLKTQPIQNSEITKNSAKFCQNSAKFSPNSDFRHITKFNHCYFPLFGLFVVIS